MVIYSHSNDFSFLFFFLLFFVATQCFDFFFCFISWSYIMEIKLNRYLLLHQLGEYVLIVCYFCFCFVKHQLAVLVWSIKLLRFLLLHLMMIYNEYQLNVKADTNVLLWTSKLWISYNILKVQYSFIFLLNFTW